MGPVCSRTYVFQEIIGSILNRPGEVGRYHRRIVANPWSLGSRDSGTPPNGSHLFVNLQYSCCFLVNSGLVFAQ